MKFKHTNDILEIMFKHTSNILEMKFKHTADRYCQICASPFGESWMLTKVVCFSFWERRFHAVHVETGDREEVSGSDDRPSAACQ
jgi:hypothetical protein